MASREAVESDESIIPSVLRVVVADRSVEWVAGDPFWSRAYTALFVGGVLALGTLLAVNVLGMLYLSGLVASEPVSPISLWWQFTSLAVTVVAVVTSLVLPRVRPVNARIGISQGGLFVRTPLRTFEIPRTEAVWFTPTRVTSRKLSYAPMLLTSRQSARVYAWWYPVGQRLSS